MSGSSYNYLCWRTPDRILSDDGPEQLEKMADRLAGLGYAEDAARETMGLLLSVRQFAVYVEMVSERLSGIWHAVEWWDSGDSGEGEVEEALTKYRRAFVKETSVKIDDNVP